MTTATATELTFDDVLDPSAGPASTPAETAAHDQADASAHDRAASRALQARRENRQMTAAWIALVFGLVVSLGTFGAIAWDNSVAAHGPTTAESTTAP